LSIPAAARLLAAWWLALASPGRRPRPTRRWLRWRRPWRAAEPASQPAGSEPLAQSLDQVITTLQSDKDRAALVQQLQARARAWRHGLGAQRACWARWRRRSTIDGKLRKDHGPWHYWRWRADFAGEEWHLALTADGTGRPRGRSGNSPPCWPRGSRRAGCCGSPASACARLAQHTAPSLPAVPSWIDVALYMLRR
jgi:hypothetical protein